MTRDRADRLMVRQGLVPSREQAQALIAAGNVLADGKQVNKASQKLPDDCVLLLEGAGPMRVSRAGEKLDHALAHFNLEVGEAVCLDIGASTGGFTEVLLREGARRVYAVDVGHDQLAETLKRDSRVVSLEGVNARYLSRAEVTEPIDVLVCDASFISLAKALEKAIYFVRPGGVMIALVKPQFEVGRDRVGKGGLVRDHALHDEVCSTAIAWLESLSGWRSLGLADSPITGTQGNREFLMAGVRDR
ncbi:MAG: TlyA family RNA methyltransferase [Pseudomonadota bacterium]